MLYNNNALIIYGKEIVMVRRKFNNIQQKDRGSGIYSLNNNIKIIYPKEIKISFEDIIGHHECKRELSFLLKFLENSTKYEQYNIFPYCKYMLVGPDGVGKSTLVTSLAKTANIPIIVVEPSFFYNTDVLLEEVDGLFEKVIETIKEDGNCILLLKEVQYIISIIPEVLQPFLEKLLGYFREMPQLIAFATLSTSGNEIEIHKFLIDKPAFNKIIQLFPPELKIREQILEDMLKGIPVDEKLNIHRVALDTYQMTTGEIKNLVRDAALHSLQSGNTVITYTDFVETLAQANFGYIRDKLDEKERLATARHEAGHVVAGYFSSPDTYKVSKVEITPRSMYLGITQETVDESKKSFFKRDIENRIISCLGGMASEEFYYGETTSGVENDLEQATMRAIEMFKCFGMSKEIGPMHLFSEAYTLEILDNKADILIQAFMKEMYKKTKGIINQYSDALEELTQALLDNEVVYSEEVIEILKKYHTSK